MRVLRYAQRWLALSQGFVHNYAAGTVRRDDLVASAAARLPTAERTSPEAQV
jgi:hypothetical protein